MHIEDIDHESLLELAPKLGTVRFAGQRTVLMDVTAMGVLRTSLVENFGMAAARVALTQLGFAQGWRMASAMESAGSLDSSEKWQDAGLEIGSLQGWLTPALGCQRPLSKEGAMLSSTYESEQHLTHVGVSSSPVCWTVCGLLSGYLSRASGEETYVLEDRCVARGDPTCHLLGRTAAQWREVRAEEVGSFDDKDLSEGLEVSFQQITEMLKTMEKKPPKRHRSLARSPPETDAETETGTVARSAAMREVIELARRVAKVDATVVISGESGTGKERIARLLHEESSRAAGPFLAVNCAAITESLLESELFGHARGAFSGAVRDRPGLFEAAHGGTLFLDEVGEIPLGMQTKLLRVLQEREVRRVGENKSRSIDVRIVTASNMDIERAVHNGSFRQDLYYRLWVVALRLPPLRERREDILPLARVLLSEASTRMSRPVKTFSVETVDLMLRYAWPGNVRELENAMERAAALSEGARVEVADLPEEVRRLPSSPPPGAADRTLHDVEKEHILASLLRNGGNQVRTSAQLQIGTATLYRKLKSYESSEPDDEPTGRK